MGLDQSLISAVVPGPHNAHGIHTSIKEMLLTQKFTLGTVKFTPKNSEGLQRSIFSSKESSKANHNAYLLCKNGGNMGELDNGGMM